MIVTTMKSVKNAPVLFLDEPCLNPKNSLNGWIVLGYLYSMCVILLYDLKFVSPLKNSDLEDEICFWEWSLFGGHVNVQGGKPIFLVGTGKIC